MNKQLLSAILGTGNKTPQQKAQIEVTPISSDQFWGSFLGSRRSKGNFGSLPVSPMTTPSSIAPADSVAAVSAIDNLIHQAATGKKIQKRATLPPLRPLSFQRTPELNAPAPPAVPAPKAKAVVIRKKAAPAPRQAVKPEQLLPPAPPGYKWAETPAKAAPPSRPKVYTPGIMDRPGQTLPIK